MRVIATFWYDGGPVYILENGDVMKTLADAVSDLWAASVAQVYDEWHGWYQVVELVDGQYQPRNVLSRDAALNWQNPDPNRFALNMKHVQRWSIYGPLPA